MFFNEILYGTQYYRSPTPLKEEWEGDLANLQNYSLNVFQIRINWRNNERKRGEYDFSDVDELLRLAKKNGLKVCMKFLLECAPQYVYDELDGSRIGAKGEKIRGGYHGAFYGGFKPCFNNPKVKEAAERFVKKTAERYYQNEDIILWNAWNEPRNKPIEECFCPHCRKAFGKYLQGKFQTLERMNAFYGATEESFDNVNLPAMAHGYWDIFEFKKFQAGETQYNNLRFVYDAIREYDKKRPIMSHIGYTAAFQDDLGDVCNDLRAKEAVDFWGTSIPFDTDMSTNENRLNMQLLLDFMRSLDKNFFLHEIYPGLGMFRWYDTPFDMQFKLYSALACGAKGMFFWQYRAERVGNENDCAGLMRADGSPRPVAYAVRDFGQTLKADMSLFASAKAEKADIAVMFDFDCSLMSMIEDGSLGPIYTFQTKNAPKYYYKSHHGAYKMFRNLGYKVDYIISESVEKFNDYKVLFLPYQCFVSDELKASLERFVAQGGTLILDEGFGTRTLNTWMNPYDVNLDLLKARVKERHFLSNEETLQICGQDLRIYGYKSRIHMEGGEILSTFQDDQDELFGKQPAAYAFSFGKGKVYLFGFSLGYSYAMGEKRIAALVNALLPKDAGKYAYADTENGIYEKTLISKDGKIVFIMNAESKEFTLCKPEKLIKCGAQMMEREDTLVVPPRSSGYFVTEE